jgi:HD-like signal output (HDOD) protein
MSIEALKQHLAGQLKIPSLPEIVVRLDQLISGPDFSMAEVGRYIACDPPLAARVLAIANSSYFGLRSPVSSIDHAASVLGTAMLRNLLLQISLFDQFAHLDRSACDLRRHWNHSILTGRLMVELSRHSVVPAPLGPDGLYVAGLLHDIGELILLDAMPQQYLEAVKEAKRTGRRQDAVEMQRIGSTHAEVGSFLLRRWRLPEGCDALVRGHHDVKGRGRKEPGVGLLIVADELGEALAAEAPERLRTSVDPATMSMLGLSFGAAIDIGERVFDSLGQPPF